MAVATDYGRHVLDMALEDVMPEGPGRQGMRRRALMDQPGVRADDEFHVARKKIIPRSQLLAGLRALIDAALARAGAFNSDDDEPDLVALCDRAGLTLSEYEATTMRVNGLKWSEIAKAQGISQSRARRAAERGLQKVHEFITS